VKDSHLQPSRSERDASSVGLTRHELAHPAGLPPADSPFEAEDDNNFTTDAEMVGRLGFAPSSRRLRAGTSLSKFATQSRHEGGVEPPQPGLCSPRRHRYSRRVKWSKRRDHKSRSDHVQFGNLTFGGTGSSNAPAYSCSRSKLVAVRKDLLGYALKNSPAH
jgi:hypothetical protein